MNDLSKKIINDAVELAKENALSVLKGLNFDDIKALVEAEMTNIITPLEDKLIRRLLTGLRFVTVYIYLYIK